MEEKTLTPQEQNREWAEEAFWTGHCHYLLQALALAMQRCQVWRLTDTGDVFTLIELFNFAKAYDESHPLDDNQFYRTTVEGAIGLCMGVEYLTSQAAVPHTSTLRRRLQSLPNHFRAMRRQAQTSL